MCSSLQLRIMKILYRETSRTKWPISLPNKTCFGVRKSRAMAEMAERKIFPFCPLSIGVHFNGEKESEISRLSFSNFALLHEFPLSTTPSQQLSLQKKKIIIIKGGLSNGKAMVRQMMLKKKKKYHLYYRVLKKKIIRHRIFWTEKNFGWLFVYWLVGLLWLSPAFLRRHNGGTDGRTDPLMEMRSKHVFLWADFLLSLFRCKWRQLYNVHACRCTDASTKSRAATKIMIARAPPAFHSQKW